MVINAFGLVRGILFVGHPPRASVDLPTCAVTCTANAKKTATRLPTLRRAIFDGGLQFEVKISEA